jgi:hypothetical protein
MTEEYISEYGRRWHIATPRAAIKRYVARQHVARPIAEIIVEIERAICCSADKAKFTSAIRRECAAYAKLCHERNNKLFRFAIRGH